MLSKRTIDLRGVNYRIGSLESVLQLLQEASQANYRLKCLNV